MARAAAAPGEQRLRFSIRTKDPSESASTTNNVCEGGGVEKVDGWTARCLSLARLPLPSPHPHLRLILAAFYPAGSSRLLSALACAVAPRDGGRV